MMPIFLFKYCACLCMCVCVCVLCYFVSRPFSDNVSSIRILDSVYILCVVLFYFLVYLYRTSVFSSSSSLCLFLRPKKPKELFSKICFLESQLQTKIFFLYAILICIDRCQIPICF